MASVVGPWNNEVDNQLEDLRHVVVKLHEKLVHQKTEQGQAIKEVMTYADKVLATVLGMFTAQTFFKILMWIEMTAGIGDGLAVTVAVRLLHVTLTTIFVAVSTHALTIKEGCHAGTENSAWLVNFYSHSDLIELSLPMLVAWAWKDLASDVITWGDDAGQRGWVIVLLAFTSGAFVAFLETSKSYKAAAKLDKKDSDTYLNAFIRIPAKLYLAIGFIWNTMVSYPRDLIIGLIDTDTSFYSMAMMAVWFVLVAYLINQISKNMKRWKKHGWKAFWPKYLEAKKTDEEQPEAGGAQGTDDPQTAVSKKLQEWETVVSFHMTSLEEAADCAVQLVDVLLNSFAFVYGWQLLDTINEFFFHFLLGCDGPTSCSYQANLAFASMITCLFAWLAVTLRTRIRWGKKKWQEIKLFSNALSLNVGWAWMNYCNTLIAEVTAQGHQNELLPYIICFGICLPCLIFFHLKMHTVYKTWDVQTRSELDVDKEYMARMLGYSQKHVERMLKDVRKEADATKDEAAEQVAAGVDADKDATATKSDLGELKATVQPSVDAQI